LLAAGQGFCVAFQFPATQDPGRLMVRQFDASHVEPEQHIIGCAEEAHVRTDWFGAQEPE